jgi:hypothetical protein
LSGLKIIEGAVIYFGEIKQLYEIDTTLTRFAFGDEGLWLFEPFGHIHLS